MVDVVGVVDASTVQVTGTVAVTSPSFVDASSGYATLPISSDDVDVEGTALNLSEWIDANATRRVSVFASDVDASGGSFTDVPLYESVEVPRAVLAGLTMLVVDGDDLGLWTITASGPCTAGAALAPGDVVASTSGRIAVAQTNDGTTVAGVLVAALVTSVSVALASINEDISALETADGVQDGRLTALEATDATTTANLTSLTTYVDVIEARLRMVAQANRVAAPTLWAVGGGSGAVWEADWQAPNPTSTFEVEAWVKVLDAREPGFIEIVAESIDGEGDLDRFEVADWYADEDEDGFIEEVHGYAEGTRAGEDIEYHRPGEGHTQLDNSALSPIVPGIWVRRLWVYDFTAHTITTYVEDDLYWHIERYGRRWVPIGTYTNPIIDSLRATEGYPTWLIRGVGDHLLAYEAIYVDGVEVQRFDPSTAEIGDSTVDDSVASGITWTGSGTGAEIDGVTSGGGAVDSVNGQTGTVVLGATDVGAVADDDSRLASIPTYVWATSNVTRSGAASKADDTELKFTGAANTRYAITAYVQVSGDASADVTIGLSAPTGATCSLFMDYNGGAVAAASGVAQQSAHISTLGSGGAVPAGVIAAPGIAIRLTGWVQLSSTAGDVALYWGPNSNGAMTGVTRHANSHLIHTP